ncbi:MAG TPA: hypothetical protein VIE43_13605 [Thermoanaerobaculia bacterium]|nr:hypothetical protein [Thermoanaerobaculia bacterium]
MSDPVAEPQEPELHLRLRAAASEELLALLRANATELAPPDVRQALRNPYCTAEAIGLLAGEERLLSFYEVRRDLALHPSTPETLAARFVPTLYWRDLMALALDLRLRPALRRSAEIHLGARLPGMATGEKISLARRVGGGVLAQLRHDPSPQVIAALLDNPRLTEGVLGPVLHSAATPPAILELIANDRRWGVRYPLRLALVRNPVTPLKIAWRLLETLRAVDLKPVAADPRLPEPVRRRARVLLGPVVDKKA